MHHYHRIIEPIIDNQCKTSLAIIFNLKNIVLDGWAKIIAPIAMVRNIQKPPTSHHCYAKEIDIASLSKFDHRPGLRVHLLLCIRNNIFFSPWKKLMILGWDLIAWALYSPLEYSLCHNTDSVSAMGKDAVLAWSFAMAAATLIPTSRWLTNALVSTSPGTYSQTIPLVNVANSLGHTLAIPRTRRACLSAALSTRSSVPRPNTLGICWPPP